MKNIMGDLKPHVSESKISTCETHGDFTSTSFSPFGNKIFWSTCEKCIDKSEDDRAQQEILDDARAKQEAIDEKLQVMEVPTRYRGVKLNQFIPYPQQQGAYVKAKTFAANFNVKKSQVLILAGTTGTGKTMLASALMQSLMIGRYLRAVDIGRLIRGSFSTQGQTEKSVIDSLVEIPLLVIDEVGVQYGTENETMLITDIIDRRYAELKSTVIISNLNTKNLAQSFGERAWDRIKQDATYEPMEGESLRTN